MSVDIKQFADLLTGLMTDQPVTIGNDLATTGPFQQKHLATPPTPPAGQMRLYPKSDGRYYQLDSAGLEVPLGTDTGIPVLEVWVNPDEPTPREDYSLWIDTDAPETGTGVPGFATYTHTQLAPSDTWVIPHALHCFPSVTVVDSGESVVIPSVHYDSEDVLTVIFGSPTSGKAYLN